MANYASLKAAIQEVVKTNGNNEITGALLQQSLLAMINSLGGYYQFAGVATPSTNPGTPDQNVFYLAGTAGTYSNFNSIVLASGEVAILKYNGTWIKETSGFASQQQLTELADIILLQKSVPSAHNGSSLNTSDGALVTNQFVTQRGVTDFVPVVGGKQLYIKSGSFQGGTGNYCYIAFYSSNTEASFISSVVYPTYATPVANVYVNVPANAHYARLVLADYNTPIVLGGDKDITEYLEQIEQEIDALDARIDSIVADDQMSDTSTNPIENRVVKKYIDDVTGYPIYYFGSVHNGYTLDGSGKLITNQYVTQRGVSAFIPVTPGSRIYIKSGAFQGGSNNYCYAAFYGSNNESNVISVLINKSYSTEITNRYVDVPAGANYVRFVLANYNTPVILGGDKTIAQRFDELVGRVEALENNFSIDENMSDTSERPVQNKVIKQYVDGITGFPVYYLESKTNGYSLDNTGKLITNQYVTQRGVTDFIPITPGGKLYVKSGVFQGGTLNYAAIAFYASNNENSFVSCINSSPYATEIINKTFNIPATANYARFVLGDYAVAAIIGPGAEKTIAQRLAEQNVIAKNYGKSIVVFGGSHTARENSEAAKNIWREKLGLDVYTAGVGSTGIVMYLTMYGWTYNGVSYYTRGGFNEGVGTRVWDDLGYLSNLTITAKTETTITLSDGNTYTRDTTVDYVSNAQTKISRLVAKSQLNKDIYLVWLSTNDYVYSANTCPIGTFEDYTAKDNYDITKTFRSTSERGTVCGGFNYILKTIREQNPSAEIYVFTSFRFFNNGEKGYDPYTTDEIAGLNFYQFQQEILKAARVGGCAILDQFMLQGIDIFNYETFYESDALHLKISGYERIGYVQADFLANGY